LLQLPSEDLDLKGDFSFPYLHLAVRINIFCGKGFLPSPPPGYIVISILKLVLINLIYNPNPLFKKERRQPPIKMYLPPVLRTGEL
jgi:hypothetical protein